MNMNFDEHNPGIQSHTNEINSWMSWMDDLEAHFQTRIGNTEIIY